MAAPGLAGRGEAGQGKARKRLYALPPPLGLKTKLGEAGHGAAGYGVAWHGEARRGQAGCGMAGQSVARLGMARRGTAKRGEKGEFRLSLFL